MSAVNATLQMYGQILRETVEQLPRTALALGFLYGMMVIVVGTDFVTGGTDMTGGLLVSLLTYALAGWHLALVEISVQGTRSLTFADLRETASKYFGDVLMVAFVFWMPIWFLSGQFAQASLGLIVAASIIFSAGPEMLYQEDDGWSAVFMRSPKFIQENWPEWLGFHVPAWLLLGGLLVALDGGWNQWTLAEVAQIFGPFFGYPGAGRMVLGSGAGVTAQGGVAFLLVGLVVHLMLIGRGKLYKRLKGSTRRGRIWAARH